MAGEQEREVFLQGNLTFSSVELVDKNYQFIFEDNSPIIFNLSRVEKSDSSALVLLVKWLRQAKQMNKLISFRDGSQQLINLIKLSDLQRIIFW